MNLKTRIIQDNVQDPVFMSQEQLSVVMTRSFHCFALLVALHMSRVVMGGSPDSLPRSMSSLPQVALPRTYTKNARASPERNTRRRQYRCLRHVYCSDGVRLLRRSVSRSFFTGEFRFCEHLRAKHLDLLNAMHCTMARKKCARGKSLVTSLTRSVLTMGNLRMLIDCRLFEHGMKTLIMWDLDRTIRNKWLIIFKI